MKQFDIIVVGGGILGVAHAYHALLAGYSVALMEQNARPMDASVRNFGQIVPSGFASEWQQYGIDSTAIYAYIQSKKDISVRQEGSIYLASNEEELALIEELASINKSNSYKSHLLTKQDCLERYPMVKSDYIFGALHFPQEIILDPQVAIHAVIDYCIEQLGLTYLPFTKIVNVINANGHVQMMSSIGKSFMCEKAIITTGTDFNALFPDYYQDQAIKIVRLQMMALLPQEQVKVHGSILTGRTIRRYEAFQECPSYRAIKAREDKNSYAQLNGVHILFKQNSDGTIILGDSHHYARIDEAEAMHFHTDAALNDFMIAEAQNIMNLGTCSLKSTWLGYYSQMDAEPILNMTVDRDIHIVTAIGGKGMTASLGYAKMNIKQII